MDKLPNEIEDYIFQYIPVKTLALCCKKYWTDDYKTFWWNTIKFKRD